MSKRAYPCKLRAQLSEWEKRIDQLRRRMEQEGAAARLQFEHQIHDLQAKQSAARRKLAQLEDRLEGNGRTAGNKLRLAVRRILSGAR